MKEAKDIRQMTQDEMAQERTTLSEERTSMAEERTSMAHERTSMAQERTSMAFDRTSLANTQTLLSYFRTAIATLAAGVGLFEFINNEIIVKVGIALMAVSPAIVILGVIHFIVVRKRLKEQSAGVKKG